MLQLEHLGKAFKEPAPAPMFHETPYPHHFPQIGVYLQIRVQKTEVLIHEGAIEVGIGSEIAGIERVTSSINS